MPGRASARTVCLAMVGTLAWAGCPSPEPRDRPGPPDGVTCTDYVRGGLAVEARSRDAFRALLGEPERTVSETVANRHDPTLTDTLFRLEYPGLTVRIHRPAELGDLLERVEVRDNQYLTYPELGVGAGAGRIVAVLGEPDERTEGQLLYVCDPGLAPEEPVLFVLEEGRVREIQFSFYVD